MNFLQTTFSVLCFSLILTSIIFAQYPNVRVSSVGFNDPEEVTIAINPVNPNILAAGANINYFYRSTNGGTTWIQNELSSTLGVWGDPVVIFDSLGYLYYSHLSNPISGYWIDRIVIQRSTDHGISWNDGAGVGYTYPKNQDKEWLAVDLTRSPYRGNIYTSWTEFDDYGSSSSADSSRILFSRSTDQGITWSTPLRLSERGGNCIDSDETVEGAVPAVGPNGEIYVSWAGPLGIVFDKSTNGGVTFGSDIFVNSMPGGWDFNVPGIYRCNGMPITACDISFSPNRGNIYICWGDQRNGTTNSDVFMSKSTDGGNTWSAAKKVNDDVTDRHQFFPWMTVDPKTGIIYVVFYDRRNTTGSATDVYVARSIDGGETFMNFKVSESPFTPSSGIFFGDYSNIAAFNGMVYPIWMRLDGSSLSVWTAIINDSSYILPVELSEFTSGIDNGSVNLFWRTSSELNNRGFEVQRASILKSKQGGSTEYITIGFVEGKGTTSQNNSYSFADKPENSGVYKYRLKQIDYNGDVNYSEEIEINLIVGNSFKLDQNYPNPFNPVTTISYQLPEASYVTLKVYDVLGEEILTLVNKEQNSGVHEVSLDAGRLTSGIYLYKIQAGAFEQTRKMILLK
ncbi:MAG: T9SS type A sorting domain-containing protein [Ignavibacteriales bacterium]|nr:MAG: T9SS type A sorting domain-containing protein [Ignavibacteriales bacterium]